MKMIVVSILLAGAMGAAGVANAQGAAPPDPPPSVGGDAWQPMGPAPDNRTLPWSGISAMKANDFVAAEAMFADFLVRKAQHAEANLYMGVIKMNLGKWDEARGYLETAATLEPTHPDPRIRLGVTYAKLGDTTAALAQRAELARMRTSFSFTSRTIPSHVREGIAIIDNALEEASRG